MKITVANVCFIKDKENKQILLLKRNNEPMRGLVAGVGGKTRFDEDIKESCIREVKEETGLDVSDIKLKGIVKTILEGQDKSWILFVYTASSFEGELCDCNEGELCWVDNNSLYDQNLIGFIRRVLPCVLEDRGFVEGTIVHDVNGNIIEEKLHSTS